MKNWMLAALTAGALLSAQGLAHADGRGRGGDKDRGSDRHDRGDRGNKGGNSSGGRGGNVAAPEIDGASGALAIALAGGGLALLQRSRRRRD